jgi:phospholipase C
MDVWNATSSYDLSVYGPNGFVRSFTGSVGQGAAILDVSAEYEKEDRGAIECRITNVGGSRAGVSVLDAYTGNSTTQLLQPRESFENELSLIRYLAGTT